MIQYYTMLKINQYCFTIYRKNFSLYELRMQVFNYMQFNRGKLIYKFNFTKNQVLYDIMCAII